MRKSTMTLAAAGMVSSMLIGGNLMAADAKAAPKAAVKKAAAKPKADKWAFLPAVVAEIDGKKITREEVGKMIDKMLAGSPYASMMTEQLLKGMSYNVIRDYFDMQLLLKLAALDGIKPSPAMVMQELSESIKKAPEKQLASFKQQLVAQGKTMDQYKKEIAANKTAQDQIAIQNWVKTKLEPTLKVTPAEEKEFYEKNKKSMFYVPEQVEVSHILIGGKKDEAGKKASKAKAEKLLADIKAGKAKFEDVAQKESLCPSGKNSKGRLEKFQHGMMAPAFDAASFALKNPGDLSGIVETSFGYHIIRLEKKYAAKQMEMSDPKVQEAIKNSLKGEMLRKIIKSKLDEAKKKYKAKLFVKPPAKPKAPAAPVAPPTK